MMLLRNLKKIQNEKFFALNGGVWNGLFAEELGPIAGLSINFKHS